MFEFIKRIFKKDFKPEQITCANCKNLIEWNDGSVSCLKQNEYLLEYFNKNNIRPCKEINV